MKFHRSILPFPVVPLVAALGIAMPVVAMADDAFISLGTLGGSSSSYASAVSADGVVVVGTSITPFRSTPEGGMVSLGSLGGLLGTANAVSGDGSTVAGSSRLSDNSTYHAFRWTQADGMTDLGTLGGIRSEAFGVSGDGSVVVGYSEIAGPWAIRAFRWTQSGGMVNLGTLPGGTSSQARGVSGDGSVVVGYSSTTEGPSRAFRWTGGTMSDLGTLGAGQYSMALGISADGNVVVGTSRIDVATTAMHAFRWTGGTMSDLGTLVGHTHSEAYAASGNGQVVVGQSSPTGFGGWQAFRWSLTGGMQSVSAWLSSAGVSVPAGWTLENAADVSSDGSVVVGTSADASGEAQAYLARVGGAGTGLLTNINDYSGSLTETGSIGYVYGNFNFNVIVAGAHHRSLLDNGLVRTAADGSCAWATADTGRQAGNNLKIDVIEAGFCRDIGSTRLGIGIGTTRARQDLSLGGSAEFEGQYLIAEADRLFENGLEGSALFMYGVHEATLKRHYMNGATVDQSTGNPDATAMALRLRADWRDALRVGVFGISPYASLTWGKAKVDGYTETGGGFPATYTSANVRSNDIRFGAAAKTALTSATDLKLSLEATHRFSSDDAGVDVQVIGLGGFDRLPGQNARRDSARVIVDLDHRFTNSSALTVSAISGNFDGKSSWVLSAGYRASF